MTESELRTAGVDLWLLGHTHVRFPDEDHGHTARILLPGTPEPDGFDCRHPGYAWFLEVGEDRSVRYQSLITGHHQFIQKEIDLATEADLESLKARFQQLGPNRHLVKLMLRGRLPGELFDQRAELLAELRRGVLHLEEDLSDLFRIITLEDIDREFTQGSFPHRLLTQLAQVRQSPLTLQMAYDLIREVRP
ncbi:MAG: hypothetical protein FJY85_01920 [Deltaproteobacteria bacterium]|nr:hypothetical protein [Deltaproteobacteria bacterium]